jgi:hypothetical protein
MMKRTPPQLRFRDGTDIHGIFFIEMLEGGREYRTACGRLVAEHLVYERDDRVTCIPCVIAMRTS